MDLVTDQVVITVSRSQGELGDVSVVMFPAQRSTTSSPSTVTAAAEPTSAPEL